MQWYQVLEQVHTYSTSSTYKHTCMHIHTLRQIPKMDSKVRNRNLGLKHSKSLPNPTKHPLFISFIGYQSRKPQTKAEWKRVSGNSPRRGCRRGWGRAANRADALVRLLAWFSPKNEGFSPQTPNPTIFHQNQVYITSLHLQLHLITTIMPKPQDWWPFDHQTPNWPIWHPYA